VQRSLKTEDMYSSCVKIGDSKFRKNAAFGAGEEAIYSIVGQSLVPGSMLEDEFCYSMEKSSNKLFISPDPKSV